MIISGNKKKSLNKNQEIKEEQFLNRKRKADDDQEKNSYVIMRKDYLKKDISEFSREINISSLKTSISDNSNLKSSLNNQGRLKKINEYLLSDDEKYQEIAGNPGSQLNPIRIDSLSEDGETIERLDSPLLKIMQNDDQVEQEYINRMGCAKVERILRSKPINDESNHMSNKFDNFSSNVNLDSNQNKFAKKKLSSFENQSDFIGFPSKAETVVKSVKKSVNSYYDEDIEFPWITEKSQNERGMLKLHYEILEFYEFIRPNSKEDLLREKTIKVVKDLISANFPELKVKKFGSFPNKIHLPDSDIDIVVLCESKDGQPVDQLKLLKKITQKLIDNHLVDFIKIIEARVPIIRATLKETKINMDIR
jgi:predicted nucleotidyltransferase